MTSMNLRPMASHVLAALAIFLCLWLHLVPAALSGFLVYVLVAGISRRYLSHLDDARGRLWATAAIAVVVVLVFSLAVAVLVNQLHFASAQGLAGLWQKMAEIIANAQGILPAWLVGSLPTSADDIQSAVVQLLKDHAGQLQAAGKDVGVGLVHAIIGCVVGGMVAARQVSADETQAPLRAALICRARRFTACFEKVFVGQGKIAAINATATAVYLMAVLPLFGILLPFTKTMVLLTLVMGFIPVLGNLVSNTVIVVVSASSGFVASVASLVFLVALHKAEYFLAARILGSQINARAWELLMAMLVMEAAFGVPGVITAPVIYAYLKTEWLAAEATAGA